MVSKAITPRASWFSKYVPLAGSGCVLFCPMQDDQQKDEIRDISGGRFEGTISGASWVRLGTGLWVLEFSAGDYVDHGTDSTFDFTSEDFSMMVPIKPTFQADSREIIARGQSMVDGWSLEVTSVEAIVFRTSQAGARQFSASTYGGMSSGTWYVVGISRSGSAVDIYINGTKDTPVAGTHIDPKTSSRALRLGKLGLSGYVGQMGSPLIFSGVALSAQQQRYFYSIFRDLVGI